MPGALDAGHVFVVHADITTLACDSIAIGFWDWLSGCSRFSKYVTASQAQQRSDKMAQGSVLRMAEVPDDEAMLYLIKPRKVSTGGETGHDVMALEATKLYVEVTHLNPFFAHPLTIL
jgi:hypothetical protein